MSFFTISRTRNIKEGNQEAWTGRIEIKEAIPLFARNWVDQ